MAEAIRVALEMEKPERVERHRRLFSTIKAHDTFAWSQEFLADLIKQGETGRMARMTSPSVHSALERLKRVI
jgi:trehalose 6-phosphate synthase